MAASPIAQKAARHLGEADPKLKGLIWRVGVWDIDWSPGGFHALARAIIYQQISGAAGNSIYRKTRKVAGTRGFPPAQWFVGASDEQLRSGGLSPQKIGYLRDLSRRVVDGEIDFTRFRHLTDEKIIEELTEVKGIGRWTAQMYLLFHMRRPDVLPTGDLGLRKGVQRVYGYGSLPSEKTVLRHGNRWHPYCSWGTYYMWRSLDAEKLNGA
jgi:DNA-3-methyladenine glycosylase II